MPWHAQVHGTPAGVFDREYLVVCGGFLVPTKETGRWAAVPCRAGQVELTPGSVQGVCA
jgi:hypothetical protein